MKHDFLFEILNNISDKHIEEAALYKSNVKVFPKKRVMRIAACFMVILVCALGAKVISNNISFRPLVTEDSNLPSVSGTVTVADAPNTTVGTTTTVCPIQNPLSEVYPILHYNGNTYFGYAVLVDSSRCKTKLADVVMESDDENVGAKNASVWNIEEYDAEYAIAVEFEESYENYVYRYYIYLNNKKIPETLGEFVQKTNVHITGETNDYNLIAKEKDGTELWQRKSTGRDVFNALQELVKNHGSAPCTIAKQVNYETEMVYNNMSLLELNRNFYITDTGYLYIDNDVNTYYEFEIGEEACKEFIKVFKESSCDYDPNHPVTIG